MTEKEQKAPAKLPVDDSAELVKELDRLRLENDGLRARALTIERIARVVYGVNQTYNKILGKESRDWAESKQGFMLGTAVAINGTSEQMLHEAWLGFMKDAGWKHGDKKDSGAKTHPNMVPFEELSAEERSKNLLTRVIVENLREHL